MALQNLLSQLRHQGLRSSSIAIRSTLNICGVATFLSKSSLLLPWMPMTQHFRTSPHYEPLTEVTSKRYRVSDLVLRTSPRTPKNLKVLRGERAERALIQPAAAGVRGSLVCLAFLRDSEAEAPTVFSGTVVRSDGIVATSTNCLRHLEGTEYEIGVKILGIRKTFKGVLLHTDFHSKIAFVKILYDRQLPVPKFENLDSLREEDEVVVAGCDSPYHGWKKAISCHSRGVFSSIDEMENKKPNNAGTSGKLIKAGCIVLTTFIGGPLVDVYGSVLGVIHNASGHIVATPIEDVLKCLEYFEKPREHAEDMARV